jgi:hypothetical protein
MRYDNMLWVLIAPALASCACFAVEMSSNFAESWNNRFAELRCGFAMLGGKTKRPNVHASLSPERRRTVQNGGTEAQALVDIRVLIRAMLSRMRARSSGWR